MTDVRKRFTDALKDTVNEWKSHKNVKGICVYGSYVKGTATASSDLDICIIWDADEAPVRLMSTHKEVLVDMVFMTVTEIENVFGGITKDVTKISEVINRLRNSLVKHDTKGMVSNWQKKEMTPINLAESLRNAVT